MDLSELRKKRQKHYLEYFRNMVKKSDHKKPKKENLKFSFGQGFNEKLGKIRNQNFSGSSDENEEFLRSENRIRQKRELENQFYSNPRDSGWNVKLFRFLIIYVY